MSHGYVHFAVHGLPHERWLDAFPGVISGQKLNAFPEWSENLDTLAIAIQSLNQALSGLPLERSQLIREALAAPDRLDQAKRFAEERAGQVSVEAVAARAGLSRDRFSRLFAQAYGVSPRSWLLRIRLEQAARQLLQSTDSIETIAEANGFFDRAHFSRAFGRAFDTPPAAFRKRYGA